MIESEIIRRQKSFKVLLIGESCQDIYHYGVCDRLCAEAPVPVFDYKTQEIKPGMAANVNENLLSFGLQVDFVTNPSHQLIKRRFIDTKSNQLLLREDVGHQVDSVRIPSCVEYDAVVISDYNRGLLETNEIEELCEKFRGPIFVDSKNPRLKHFKNAIIKINSLEEKRLQTCPENSELIVTMGKMGAKWNDKIFPAPKVDVFDVTGAGDVFLASLCYFYLNTNNIQNSIANAVYLASKSVQHMGVYVLTNDDIREIDK